MGTIKDIFTAVVGIAAPTRLVCRAVFTEKLKTYGIALPDRCVDEIYSMLEYAQNIADKRKELELALHRKEESFKSLTRKSELASRCEGAATGVASYILHGDGWYVDDTGMRQVLDRYFIHGQSENHYVNVENNDNIVIVVVVEDSALSDVCTANESFKYTADEYASCRDFISKAMEISGAYDSFFNNSRELFLLAFSGVLHCYNLLTHGPCSEALGCANEDLRMEYMQSVSDLKNQIKKHLAYCLSLYYPRATVGDKITIGCFDGGVGIAFSRSSDAETDITVVAKTADARKKLEEVYADVPSLKPGRVPF